MARKSKSDRINEILKLNPALKRDDSRIRELLDAETLVTKCRKEALKVDVTTESRNGQKRHPALIAVEAAETSVRRLRADLQIDRVSVKVHEATGVKVKRSADAGNVLSLFGPTYTDEAELIPGLAALLAAHGIEAEDLPEIHRERFREDLDEQQHLLPGIRERIKQ